MKGEFLSKHQGCSKDPPTEECPVIYSQTYLRGLDGQLPVHAAKEDEKQENIAAPGTKQNNAMNFFQSSNEPENLDRPVGQGQFDYLRRMADQLQQLDQARRRHDHGRRIAAIGVLGTDVFDKLLILRALKPKFPEAVFFTTDFDEAFTMHSELPWSRNLIISSSFGPKLSPTTQHDIPPFRDSGQTSVFLTTQLAIEEALHGPPSQGLVEEGNHPQVFEIERSGHRLPLPLASVKDAGPGKAGCALRASCGDLPEVIRWEAGSILHLIGGGAKYIPQQVSAAAKIVEAKIGLTQEEDPRGSSLDADYDRESLFTRYDFRSRYVFILGLTISGSALLLTSRRKMRRSTKVGLTMLSAVLYLGAGICLFWGRFASALTQDGLGEPIVLFEGVSIWPTVALRILGILLSLHLILLSKALLEKNLESIAMNRKSRMLTQMRT